jgi:hypothetical protein
MSADVSVQDVQFISKSVADKLKALEIHTIRQLAARLETDHEPLRNYLGLDESAFEDLHSDTAALAESGSEDREEWPRVHKRGVAVHRLHDAGRPRFHGDPD